ncbi:Protein ACCELERATED CELL DEATH like [Actinidia chinensis var. chinensis]|uniref:Protein ACCELERATED CELL DEATH like n=1 Tax=Actinidia chinensis var. chinensis TaxID=1590841 RepID=A0A2R6QC67_ACTCC|nr:Protein ACCELERATED CELL DEATH like [Actinidia chinensis var. chinensis]
MGRLDLKMRMAYEQRWMARHTRLEKLVRSSNSSTSTEGNTSASANKKPMDLALYKATVHGEVDNFIETLVQVSTERELSLTTIFDQETMLQNSYLHVAASFGHEKLVGFIAYHFPSLLTSKNKKGDTPLHVATRSGHTSTVHTLIRFAEDSPSCATSASYVVRDIADVCPDILLRSTNNGGNTPLHEAMLNYHEYLADYLVRMDEKVSFFGNNVVSYCENKEGKSPFYLAVESGKKATVESMLQLFIRKGCSYEDMKGKSPVHAAIRTRNKGILDLLLGKVPTLIQLRNEDGETPLHCAASIGYNEGVRYLLEKFSEFCLLERDDNGFLPIHTASERGHVDIVQKLLQYYPDGGELMTKEGENILHIAAKNGKNNVVNHILRTPELTKLLNEKDDHGNTALHLATMHWRPKVVSSLTWDKRIKLGLVNDDGMTVLDVAEGMEMMASFRKRLTWMALISAGAPQGKISKAPKVNAQIPLQHEPPNMENYKDRINTLLLVSTLVATVTYAAGFTMPGGYNSSNPDQGMATMVSKPYFQMFVICDTIALYSSMIVAVSLIWAQLGDLNLILTSLRLALPLLGISLSMMSLAFMAGVYLVVSRVIWLAYVTVVMGMVSLAILLALFIPHSFPTTSKYRVSYGSSPTISFV